jgi:hypothetical protein
MLYCLGLCKYTFAQRRNRLTTHFSEHIPGVKRCISALTITASAWAWTYNKVYLHRGNNSHHQNLCCWHNPHILVLLSGNHEVSNGGPYFRESWTPSICLNSLLKLSFSCVGSDLLLDFNPLALELDIYSLAHHLCKMWIFYEPIRVTLGNTRHFVEE